MSDVPVPPAAIERPRAVRFVLESLRFFMRWFAIFPIIGVTAALLVGFVAFGALDSFGIPDLFWRLVAWEMLLVGASLAVLFALICFVGFCSNPKRRS